MSKAHEITSIENVKEILRLIKVHFAQLGKNDVHGDRYSNAKAMIARVFKNTNGQNKLDVMTRLALIDNLYATQMDHRYFAFDDLAGQLLKESRKGSGAFVCDESIADKELWNKQYGIGKGGEEKGVAISLISKYGYFATGFKFPIFDSIVCETIPLVWPFVVGVGSPKIKSLSQNRNLNGVEKITQVVKAVNQLKENLGDDADYETLDCLLWTTGKMMKGNFEWFFSRKDYLKWRDIWKEKASRIDPKGTSHFSEKLSKENKTNGKKHLVIGDSIKKLEVDELPFLKTPGNEHLRKLYELAHELALSTQK